MIRFLPRRRPILTLFRTHARSLSVLAIVGGLLLADAPAEAKGLFQKIKEKREARIKAQEAAKPKPRPRYRSYYHDAHKDAYINHALLETEPEAERKIIIDIAQQRAFLVINGLVAVDTAVSTARRNKYTPRGTFKITEKIKTGKVSTLYHVYMPNWMRLSSTAVGMHTGDLPGYPASAGCIRLPQGVAPILFEHTPRGVEVEVLDNWDEEELSIPWSYRKPALLAAL